MQNFHLFSFGPLALENDFELSFVGPCTRVCCRKSFKLEGIHNRVCQRCKDRAVAAYDPGERANASRLLYHARGGESQEQRAARCLIRKPFLLSERVPVSK